MRSFIRGQGRGCTYIILFDAYCVFPANFSQKIRKPVNSLRLITPPSKLRSQRAPINFISIARSSKLIITKKHTENLIMLIHLSYLKNTLNEKSVLSCLVNLFDKQKIDVLPGRLALL